MNAIRLSIASTLVCLIGVTGCGTNRFEQEVQIEEAAIKLTGETISGDYQLLSTEDVKKMLDGDEPYVLVDAMPGADSYNKGHIATAVNFDFPLKVMDKWEDDVMGERKQENFEKLLGEDKERKIIVYCGFVKCARSHNAAVCARELGYTKVYRYPGGIYAWRGAGHPLTTD